MNSKMRAFTVKNGERLVAVEIETVGRWSLDTRGLRRLADWCNELAHGMEMQANEAQAEAQPPAVDPEGEPKP